MDNIGKQLRQARIDKGMTIDDLQKKTRIQKRYLIAIENGDFDQLPGQFYVKAFVKQYGEYVGVDTDSYFASSKKVEDSEDLDDDFYEEEEKIETSPVSSSPYLTRQQPQSKWHSLIPQILVIAAVVLIIFVVWFFSQRNNKNNSTIPDKGNVTTVKSKSESKMHSSSNESKSTSSQSISKTKSKSKKSSSNKNSDPNITFKSQSGSTFTYEITDLKSNGNTLTLESTEGGSWDQVDIDSKTLYSEMLPAGQSKVIEIHDNATNISVTLGATVYSKLKINNQYVDLTNTQTQGVTNLVFNIQNKEKEN